MPWTVKITFEVVQPTSLQITDEEIAANVAQEMGIRPEGDSICLTAPAHFRMVEQVSGWAKAQMELLQLREVIPNVPEVLFHVDVEPTPP